MSKYILYLVIGLVKERSNFDCQSPSRVAWKRHLGTNLSDTHAVNKVIKLYINKETCLLTSESQKYGRDIVKYQRNFFVSSKTDNNCTNIPFSADHIAYHTLIKYLQVQNKQFDHSKPTLHCSSLTISRVVVPCCVN